MKTYETPLQKATKKAKNKPFQVCEWFALCDKPATHTAPHPILGDVPCCEKHFKFATG